MYICIKKITNGNQGFHIFKACITFGKVIVKLGNIIRNDKQTDNEQEWNFEKP